MESNTHHLTQETPSPSIFEGLNPAQREAVEAVTGPVCILAGAGTGKTTTITRRLAHQVASGAFPAASLLAVTFTDKAATEMRTRIQRLGVTGVRASTFHSAALSQLRHYGRAPGDILPSKGLVLGPLVRSLPKPYRFVPLMDIAAEIEWAKNQRMTPERYRSAAEDREPPIPADLMHRIFARYEERKAHRGAIDFEDMLELAVQMFDDLVVVRDFASRYEAFTVDEYQDVNLLQQTLLERWLDGRNDICVVGDDYQAIYSFTGASPRHLLEVPDRIAATKVVVLETNYRSSPQILEVANRLMPRLGGARKTLRPNRPDGPAPVLRGFDSPAAERAFIAREIASLHDDGIAYEAMAILYRINARSEDYEEILGDRGIPYQVRDDPFLDRAAARQFRPRLRALDSTDVVGQVTATALSLGYDEGTSTDASRQEYTRQKDLARFVRLAEEFDDGQRTLRDFVAEVGRRFGGQSGGGGVNLLTLHRAKGLEFEAVFVPKVERNELPHRRADIAEERRLFYVALTRAKRHLYVTWADPSGRGTRSPFVAELLGDAAPRRVGPPPSAKPKKERATEVIPARIGLRVAVAGHEGPIEEVAEEGVAIRVPGGGLLSVTFGERVVAGGRTGYLSKDAGLEPSHGIFEALKRWRRERSETDGVPAFVVAHDSTLAEIAARRPGSTHELASVRGMGETKIARYGNEILAVLSDTPGPDR